MGVCEMCVRKSPVTLQYSTTTACNFHSQSAQIWTIMLLGFIISSDSDAPPVVLYSVYCHVLRGCVFVALSSLSFVVSTLILHSLLTP